MLPCRVGFCVFDLRNLRAIELRDSIVKTAKGTCMLLSPDQTRLFLGTTIGKVLVVDTNTFVLVDTFATNSKRLEVTSLCLGANGANLYAGYSDGGIRLWSVNRVVKMRLLLPKHKGRVTNLGVLGDDSQDASDAGMLYSFADSQAKQWKLDLMKVSREYRSVTWSEFTMAWVAFLSEFLQMISFAFTTDYLWPSQGGAADDIVYGLTFQIQLQGLHVMYYIVAAAIGLMVVFVICYVVYDGNVAPGAIFKPSIDSGCKFVCWLFSTALLLHIIKGAFYLFQCTRHDLGDGTKLYHDRVGDGKEYECFAGDHLYMAVACILPMLIFSLLAIRLRIVGGKINGVKPETKLSFPGRSWRQDEKPSSCYHFLVRPIFTSCQLL